MNEKIDSQNCIVDTFHVADDKIDIYFKNGSFTTLKAKNFDGEVELEKIGQRMEEFLGKTYVEFLEAEI